MVGVAVFDPGRDLAFERGAVGDAPAETLPGQNGQFRFRHVEPAAVLGRVVPLEALDEAAGLLRRERLVERGWCVRVEVVLDQHDPLGAGEVDVAQVFQDVGEVDTACGFAAGTIAGRVLASHYSVNCLAPAVGQSFVARAKVVRAGKKQVFASAEFFAEDGTASAPKLVATGNTILVPVQATA
jgi:thioesterase superfamily protein